MSNAKPQRARQGAQRRRREVPKQSWRDHLSVHPAAELFPLMGDDELRATAEDIEKNGLREPVTIWRESDKKPWQLLDGRNRLDALELLGRDIPFVNNPCAPVDLNSSPFAFTSSAIDPVAFVISKNIVRRHLNAEQKRELTAKLLKARPEKSNREIATLAHVDHKTVATIREQEEATGEIPQLEKTKGRDGRTRPTRHRTKPAKPGKALTGAPAESRENAGGGAEVGTASLGSEENSAKCKIKNAELEPPANERAVKLSAYNLSEFIFACRKRLPLITVAADQEKARTAVVEFLGAKPAAESAADQATVHEMTARPSATSVAPAHQT